MIRLNRKEKKDRPIKFLTRESQYLQLRQVAEELNIGISEVIRDSIQYSIEKYYELKSRLGSHDE